MEILIILIFVGVFIYALHSLLSTPDAPPSKRPRRNRRRAPMPEPFDASTSRPQLGDIVVHGSAYIVDGDSLIIARTQVRLFGVDAPELNHPYGKIAKQALMSLCKGESVRAEVVAQDIHGRTVAQCYLPDGRDLSAEMVKLGLAIDWAKYSGGKYRALEVPDARKRMWLADARQKGRMHVWEQYDAQQAAKLGSP